MQRSDYDFDVITGPSTPLPEPKPARPAEPAQPKDSAQAHGAQPRGQTTHG